SYLEHSGEVTERPKVRHWKCRVGVKPHRGFESRPLRFHSLRLPQPVQSAGRRRRCATAPSWTTDAVPRRSNKEGTALADGLPRRGSMTRKPPTVRDASSVRLREVGPSRCCSERNGLYPRRPLPSTTPQPSEVRRRRCRS